MSSYLIPATETRVEIRVLNSRFIATIVPAFSVEEARQFVARVREEMGDASHHVPAFLIGHG
ncbi:MAG: YigZ family protein, partial [Anaerolineales bacterium]|nr:YigZ family protein [Anaerolineales bacterium]